jgi:RHS repeat-associated protein
LPTTLTDAINSGQKQCFGYDALNRLTQAFTGDAGCSSFVNSGIGAYNHSYTYNAIGNITSNAGNAYVYGSNKPHAVTAAFGNSYGYDANGNQTSRTIGGIPYDFTFDYDNRITDVKQGSTTLGSFMYDADGNRVLGTVGGVTTAYIAGLYEWQAGATTKYYDGGAMRRSGYAANNGITYVLGDQLGSSSKIVSQSGALQSSNYYSPFGGNRGGSAFSDLTTKRFTGQYHEAGLPGGEGLSYYNARWYDAQLGRFASADSIVPRTSDPQALNRFAYSSNNPISRMDPSGHGDCLVTSSPACRPPQEIIGRNPQPRPCGTFCNIQHKPSFGLPIVNKPKATLPFIGPVRPNMAAGSNDWGLDEPLRLYKLLGWTLDGREHVLTDVERLVDRVTITYQVSIQHGSANGAFAYLHTEALESGPVTVTRDGVQVITTSQTMQVASGLESNSQTFYGIQGTQGLPAVEYREVVGVIQSYTEIHNGNKFSLQATVTTKRTVRPWMSAAVVVTAAMFAASGGRCVVNGTCAPMRLAR